MNPEKNQVERKPVLAVVASVVMPGLGQLYNGQPRKGLALFATYVSLIPILCWIVLQLPEQFLAWGIISAGLVGLSLWVIAIVDAYRSAKRIGQRYTLARFNRAYVYISIFLCGKLLIQDPVTDFTKAYLLEIFRVPESSGMLPSILPGDQIIADKRFRWSRTNSILHRGDTVVFRYPKDPEFIYIKRVIGLPGDQIEIRGTELIVNGASIRGEEVQSFENPELDRLLSAHSAFREQVDGHKYISIWKKGEKRDSARFTVPSGTVFVIGDNRDFSNDSRFFGPVPVGDVIGKLKHVWLSMSPEFGIRWSRLGALIE